MIEVLKYPKSEKIDINSTSNNGGFVEIEINGDHSLTNLSIGYTIFISSQSVIGFVIITGLSYDGSVSDILTDLTYSSDTSGGFLLSNYQIAVNSNWNAVKNRIEFNFQRKDTFISFATGLGNRTIMTIKTQQSHEGIEDNDKCYISSSVYETGWYNMLSSTVILTFREVEISDLIFISAGGTNDFANIPAIKKNYKFLISISTKNESSDLEFTSNQDGTINCDVSGILESKLKQIDNFDYSTINLKNENLSDSFTISYKEKWFTDLLNFDSTDTIVTITDTASIQNLFDSTKTIEAWVYFRSGGENGAGIIIYKGQWNLIVVNETANGVNFRFAYAFSGGNGIWTTQDKFAINTWYHVKLTYNNSSTSNDPIFEINGLVKNIVEDSAPIGTRNSDIGIDLYIGNSSPLLSTWDGYIKYLKIINESTDTVVHQYNFDEGSGTTAINRIVFLNGTIADGEWVQDFMEEPTDLEQEFNYILSEKNISEYANMWKYLPNGEGDPLAEWLNIGQSTIYLDENGYLAYPFSLSFIHLITSTQKTEVLKDINDNQIGLNQIQLQDSQINYINHLSLEDNYNPNLKKLDVYIETGVFIVDAINLENDEPILLENDDYLKLE